MASLNNLQLIGNLGADPELRYTDSGKAVVDLRVAVNRNYKDVNGEWETETTWFRVQAWEQRAERLAETLKKGDQVFVEGRIKPIRLYKRQDDTVGAQLEVAANNVQKLGRSDRQNEGSFDVASLGESGTVQQRTESAALDVDDIPF